ncbi:MAG: hypothetical protein J6V82_00870, partial [Clostridia bacterium]|nr:hypothetical protein [Clostridia bacterium]
MKKRLLSFALAFLMVLSCVPTMLLPIFAVEAPSAQNAEIPADSESVKTADPYAALYVQDNLLFR